MGTIIAVVSGKKSFADIPELRKINKERDKKRESGKIDFTKLRVLLLDGSARQTLTILNCPRLCGQHKKSPPCVGI